jgi:secreted PhoX family phosphatase
VVQRREFLKVSVLGGVAFAVGSSWPRLLGASAAGTGPYGPLLGPDANGLELPAGFSSRVVATAGSSVPGTSYGWPAAPDGGACFPVTDGGWVYVANSELDAGAGGASMVRFDSAGTVVEDRRILSGTNRNCAGGPTPWGTWLSCEEVALGRVWETDPLGLTPAVARLAMGRFNHEAAAVDPVSGFVYLTEDVTDGAVYRFRPSSPGNLSSGVLEVMTESGGVLGWAQVPDPSATSAATRNQVTGTKRFNGGEGAWFDAGKLYFTTKGDNRVWTYDVAANQLAVIYDDSTSPTPSLTGVDNVTVARSGDVFVAEDGGTMELVILSVEGDVAPFLHLGISGSELTGPAFDPSGTRLYFSSQRNPGRTYEVTGPFRASGGGTTTTPTGLTLTARGFKVKGKKQVELTWSPVVAGSVQVKRNGTVVAATPNDGSYLDAIAAKGGGTFTYQVCEVGGSARCSNPAPVTF